MMKKGEISLLVNNEGNSAILFHIREWPAEIFSSYGWSKSKESAVEDAKEFIKNYASFTRESCDYGEWGHATVFDYGVCSKFWDDKEEMEKFMKEFEKKAKSVNLNTIKVEFDLYGE